MTWDDLRSVLAVSKHGSLSGAARELDVTHTTIGRRLTELERSLGARLFERTPSGFQLTPAGQDVVSVAERVEREVLELEGRVLGRDVRLTGPLRVSTMDILFRRYQPVFASFLERYPGIELTVSATDDEASLVRRQADIVIRMTDTPPELLVGRRVDDVTFAPYASKALAAKVGPRAPLSNYPWLHWDERLNPVWFDAVLAKVAPGARIGVRLDVPSLALREAVAGGLGIQYLATFEGDSDARLTRVGARGTVSRGVWLLTLQSLRTMPRVRAFIDHFADALKPRQR